MIYLDVVGRCGNQMFQYAFARKISIVNDDEEINIDFFYVYEDGRKRNDSSFKNELEFLVAKNHYITTNEGTNKIYKYGSKEQIIVYKIYIKIKRFLKKVSSDKWLASKLLYKVLSFYGIYWYYAPATIKKCRQKNKFVWGYFEDPEYFDDIRNVLCDEFSPLEKKKEKNEQLYNLIVTQNSVCVSLRKWGKDEPVNSNWEVCNKEYYQKAIAQIKKQIPDAYFIVFSNDIVWAKENFDFPESSMFEDGDDEVYEKLRLMCCCKHFIISNSTFAWWAQYLGKCKNKIVISPGYWHKNEKKQNPLIQDYFQKVILYNDKI